MNAIYQTRKSTRPTATVTVTERATSLKFSTIGPQQNNVPCTVAISAIDPNGHVGPRFNGAVRLGVEPAVLYISEPLSINFVAGIAVTSQVALLGERSIHVTASVGVALFDGLGAAAVLAFADQAMYEAKQAGRNRASIYRPSEAHREQVSARLAEAEMIRTALEEERFLLYGQPILDLKRSEVCRYELLLRLRAKEGGEVLADAAPPAGRRRDYPPPRSPDQSAVPY